MKKTHIYALIDPRDDQIRYVGKTCMTVVQRLAVHVSIAKKTHTYSARWICGLLDAGLKPRWAILETIEGDWQSAEKRWIAALKSQGMRLTNLTSGGDGIDSYKHTEAAILKMSLAVKRWLAQNPDARKGRQCSAETRAKLSISLKGKCNKTDEQKRKISLALTGKSLSAETRSRLSGALKGKPKPPRSPEHCQRIAERARGRRASIEHRTSISKALTGRAFSDAHRQSLSRSWERRRESSGLARQSTIK